MSDFLTFAHQLADAAGAVIRPYFGAHGNVEAKGDQSPVTVADREAEAAVRVLIQQHFPEHSIYGEEFGLEVVSPQSSGVSKKSAGRANRDTHDYTWVIDPIDGTRAFIANRKEWGTLIALCKDGIPILGILDQPVTGERWVGVRGEPTRYSTTPASISATATRQPEAIIRTRACASLGEAELSTTSTNYFTPTQAKPVVALAQAVRTTVKDGDCYAYGLLARGARDLVIDGGLKPYDILALVPIIEGAGGVITDWKNQPVTLENFSSVIAAGDARLHEVALTLLA